MRAEYDFSESKCAPILAATGKTRITIYISDTVLDEFRARAEKTGIGYQTMMNEALKVYLAGTVESPVTESRLRQVIREEITERSQA